MFAAYLSKHGGVRHSGTGTDQSVHGGIPDDIRQMTFYHATAHSDAGEAILASGELRPGEHEAKNFLTPVAGRLYLSPSLENATTYALGGVFQGNSDPTPGMIRDGQHGYIFEVSGQELVDIQPDEDSIGEMLGTNRAPDWLKDMARRNLGAHTYRKVMDGEYIWWAKAGKKLVKLMSPEQKYDLIRRGAHVAHLGPIKFKRAFRLDKTKSKGLKRDGSDVLDQSEEVMQTRKDTDFETKHPRGFGGKFGNKTGPDESAQTQPPPKPTPNPKSGADFETFLKSPDKIKKWGGLSVEEKDRLADAPNTIAARYTNPFGIEDADLSGEHVDVTEARLLQIGDKIPHGNALKVQKHMLKLGSTLIAAGVPQEKTNKIIADAIDALAVQEFETAGRQIGDHGIRHVLGDAEMAIDIMRQIGRTDPKELAALHLATIYHDSGYVTSPGGNAGMDGRHPEWSKQYYDAHKKDEFSAMLGPEWGERIGHMIETHADANLDWENEPAASALRVADNLALFHKEKLPALFKYAPDNVRLLLELGEGKTDIESARKQMRENVLKTNFGDEYKQQLLKAVEEVGVFTPKFTLGMLGGDIRKLEWADGTVNVEMHANETARRLQEHLELGQRQFIKFAEAFVGEGQAKNAITEGGFELNKGGRTVMRVTVTGKFSKSFTLEVTMGNLKKAVEEVVKGGPGSGPRPKGLTGGPKTTYGKKPLPGGIHRPEPKGIYPPATLSMNSMGHLHAWEGHHTVNDSNRGNHRAGGRESDLYFQTDTDVNAVMEHLPKSQRRELERGYSVRTNHLPDDYFMKD